MWMTSSGANAAICFETATLSVMSTAAVSTGPLQLPPFEPCVHACTVSPRRDNASTRCHPMKPFAPVTMTRMRSYSLLP